MSEAGASEPVAPHPAMCYVSLQNVSFSLSPGKVTALVGPSGSGKSSCVNILENFYPLEGGCVLLDGKPVSAYDHKYLHRVVGGRAFVCLCALSFSGFTLMSRNRDAEKSVAGKRTAQRPPPRSREGTFQHSCTSCVPSLPPGGHVSLTFMIVSFFSLPISLCLSDSKAAFCLLLNLTWLGS